MGEWQKAQINPVMSEQEWRKRGFLAAPTRRQATFSPADGCCTECGLKIMHKRFHFHLRGFTVVGITLVLAVFITVVSLYLPH
jgi:hypothetical protein